MSEKLEKVTETLSVYQEKGVFSYGTDAVLLSAYTASHIKKSSAKCGMELCSGTGFISLMLCDSIKKLNMSAIEINRRAAELSAMSAEKSGLSDRFSVSCSDIKEVKKSFPAGSFGFAVCNPPYMTNTSGYMCCEDYKTVARHEILCNINDVFSASYHLLGTGSSLYIVYRPDRLSSLFAAAHANSFEIKNMTFVHSKKDRAPNLILCEAKKQAKEGLRVSKPFTVYNDGGSYSEEMCLVREKGEMIFGK